MSTQRTKSLEPVVYKNTKLIQVRNNISLLSRKIFNVLIYDVFTNGFSDAERFESWISLSELRTLLNQKDRHYDKILKNINILQATILQTDLSTDDNINITSVQLLGKCSIKHNALFYRLDEDIVQLILQPSIYKTLQLNILNDFSSKHALALYENIKRYEGVNSTGFRDVSFWKAILCGDNSSTYDDFRHFHNQVIKKAVKEINSFSDIFVEYDFKKSMRKVSHIRFTCKKQERKTKTISTEKTLSLVLPQKTMTFQECIRRLVSEGRLSKKVLDNIETRENEDE